MASGKVGIGNVAPDYTLDINGKPGTAFNGVDVIRVQEPISGKGLVMGYTMNGTNNGITDSYFGTSFGDFAIQTSYLTRMTVKSAGNIGIGTNNPQTLLQVAGVISPSVNNTYSLGNATYRFTEVFATNGVINTSDRREKKDIFETDLGLDFINKLRPVSYRWNTGVDSDIHYGLIAQETEQTLTQFRKNEKTSIVTYDEKVDRYGVRYSELIAPLIKAVQELYARFVGVEAAQNNQAREIASIKAENQNLKLENEAKAKEMVQLKNRLERIEKALQAK